MFSFFHQLGGRALPLIHLIKKAGTKMRPRTFLFLFLETQLFPPTFDTSFPLPIPQMLPPSNGLSQLSLLFSFLVRPGTVFFFESVPPKAGNSFGVN